jgi:hypothetical protein
MSHAVGETVWLATTFVAYDGASKSHVLEATIVGVIDGTVMIKYPASGSIRSVDAPHETFCDSEAEAWAWAARDLSAARDRVQAGIDEAVAKAASSRVGEAVAT